MGLCSHYIQYIFFGYYTCTSLFSQKSVIPYSEWVYSVSMARHGPTTIVVTCLELGLKWLLCRLLGVVYSTAQLPMMCIELLHKNSLVPRAILPDLVLPLNLVSSCTEFYHVGDI